MKPPQPIKTTTAYCKNCRGDTEQYNIPGIGVICFNCTLSPETDLNPDADLNSKQKANCQIEMFS